jgi:hypothetical protein
MMKKRKVIRAAHWKRSTSIAQDKFDVISKAILKILGTKGMRWGVLVDRVQAKIPKFEGAVHWYVTSCLRELETQGKVQRALGPPTLYSKKTKPKPG